jgi:multiple sugar transport system substrate-binding protein
VAGERLDRRQFLRLAAAGAACAAAGVGCSSGSGGSNAKRTTDPTDPAKSGVTSKQLRIAQAAHFVPGYDGWFDNEYTPAWGERNGVQVIVDHIPVSELSARAAAEVNNRRGHDLFAFLSSAPAAFEDDVVDLRDVVEEAQAKVGRPSRLIERSAYNPKTNKWFGLPDYWTPQVVSYRTDLWADLGSGGRPNTWADVVTAGPRLKASGHPTGINMSQDLDGNLNLMALLHAYGASIQNEDGIVTLNRPATVEAVKVATALWSRSQAPETLSWNDASANNRHLAGGKGSLIVNPISALRAVEKQDPAMARNIELAPALAGPGARLAPNALSIYVIWNFAENQQLAKRFLADLVLASREAFIRSEFYNVPAFPGAVPDLADLVAEAPGVEPAGKYALMAQALDWTSNFGHPGFTNAAVDEVSNQFVIPNMFAAAARGEMTAEGAVAAADAEIKKIYDRWRERGKV